MKYVMFQHQQSGGHHGVMFADRFTHSLLARGITQAHRMEGDGRFVPVGAGFINTETFETYGTSESMGLGHRFEDAYYMWGGDAVSMLQPAMLKPLYDRWISDKEFR